MSGRLVAELRLAGDPALLRSARLLVSSVAADLGFSMDEIEDLKLAVQEMCGTRFALGLVRERLTLTLREADGALEVTVEGDVAGAGEECDEAQWGLDLAQALADAFREEESDGIRRLILTKEPGSGADASAF